MKEKDLVRKVDYFGRIVIPKVIRDRLNINENDYLEFFFCNDFMLVKKYSRLGKLGNLLQDISDLISEYLSANVVIIEKDKIVASAGDEKDIFLGKIPSKSMIKSVVRRESLYEKFKKDLSIIDGSKITCSYINEAIVINDEVIGLICLYRKDKSVTKKDLKIVKMVIRFINKYLDEI